ncbi:MAG: hypothetical protein ACXIVQ_01480 [Acidimicrobiales bacterium]
MKKGRHRRFEEARALKRSQDINIEDLFESLQADRVGSDEVPSSEWDDSDDVDVDEDDTE